MLAGAQSFTAVGEWVADGPPQALAALGIRRDQLADRFEPPDEATIRRVLEAVNARRVRCGGGILALQPAAGRRCPALRALPMGEAGAGRGRQGGPGHPSCQQRRQAVHLLAVAGQQASAVLACWRGWTTKPMRSLRSSRNGALGPGRVRDHRRCVMPMSA